MTASGTAIARPFVGGARTPRPPGGGQDAALASDAVLLDAAPAPVRADGVELLGEVGGSGYRRAPGLVRRADGQTVQLTPLLYALLETIDGEHGYEDLAKALSERIGKRATADDVRLLTETKLRPLGLLQRPDGTTPAVGAPNPLLALGMKLVVSNPTATRRLTAPFAWLFRPWIVVPMVLGFALTAWWVAFEKGLASAAHQVLYQPALILVVLGLTLLSAAFHEIGHAAACRYGGARPGRMGIGLYLVWPAFYTDVSDSYRLGRAGRLRVDLGGLYFNAIFAVAAFGLWTLVHWDALLLVVAAQPLLMARQLVPFVRFDGYHILADIVGVPDLFLHIKPTLLGLLPTRWRRTEGTTLKPWVRAIVTLWVLLVIPLLAAFLLLLVVALPRLAATAWASLGLQLDAVEAGWAQAEPAVVAARLVSMLLIVLPTAGTVYLLARLGRGVARKVARATAGRPVARAGAALGAAALFALLAWALWPDDSYRPIRPGERGRVLDAPRATAKRHVVPAQPAVYTAPPAESTPAPTETARSSAGTPREAPPARPSRHAEWMVVLLPKRASDGARLEVPPSVSLPAPVAGSPTVDPSMVTPPTDAPPEPQPKETAVVTVAPPADGGDSKSGWVFPFDLPPAPKEGDNQALAVNTTDGSMTYVVALSLVWVTDGGPVEQRNTAFAAASCTRCATVAVAFQAVFVVGYARIVTPVNNAVAANYECDTCTTGALAVQLVATLTREPSEAVKKELAAVWAQLQQASTSFELQPLAQVYAELSATRTQLLDILARDGALAGAASDAGSDTPATTTAAPTTTATEPTSTTAATTTAATTGETTTATTTTEATTAATTEPPTTEPTTTTATTTTEATTAATTEPPTTEPTTTQAATPAEPTATTAPTTTEQTTTDHTTTAQTTTAPTTTTPTATEATTTTTDAPPTTTTAP